MTGTSPLWFVLQLLGTIALIDAARRYREGADESLVLGLAWAALTALATTSGVLTLRYAVEAGGLW